MAEFGKKELGAVDIIVSRMTTDGTHEPVCQGFSSAVATPRTWRRNGADPVEPEVALRRPHSGLAADWTQQPQPSWVCACNGGRPQASGGQRLLSADRHRQRTVPVADMHSMPHSEQTRKWTSGAECRSPPSRGKPCFWATAAGTPHGSAGVFRLPYCGGVKVFKKGVISEASAAVELGAPLCVGPPRLHPPKRARALRDGRLPSARVCSRPEYVAPAEGWRGRQAGLRSQRRARRLSLKLDHCGHAGTEVPAFLRASQLASGNRTSPTLQRGCALLPLLPPVMAHVQSLSACLW